MSVSGRLANRFKAWGSFDEGVVETLFYDLPDAVIYGSRDRHVLGTNPAACRIFGYEQEAFLGLPTRRLYVNEHDYDRQGEESFDPRLLRGRKRAMIHYRRGDGSEFWGETTAASVSNTDGEILGYISITRDVTRQLATERALKRLYIISADQSRDGERKIDDIVDLGRNFFGMESAIIGEVRAGSYHVRKLVPGSGSHPRIGDRFPVEETQCFRTLKAGGPFAFSERSDHAGSDLIGSYIGAPLRVEGATFGMLAFFSPAPRQEPFTSGDLDFVRIFAEWTGYEIAAGDARERLLVSRENARRAQIEAEAASRAKSRFLASASGSLKAPMAGIGATADLLARTALSDEQRRLLANLQQDCAMVMARLDDFLEQAEGGMMESPQLDRALVDEILDTLGAQNVELMLDKLAAGLFKGRGDLEMALARNDADACRRAAHFLKGQALNFGMRELADLAARIESSASRGVIDSDCFLAVDEASESAIEALRTLARHHSSWR